MNRKCDIGSCTCKRCILKELAIHHKQIKNLNERVSQLESVIRIFNSGEVTIGSKVNPVNTIYVDTIVRTRTEEEDMSGKGICLDDTTASLIPSFSSFPMNWLTTSIPIGSVRTYHYGTGVDDRVWVKWLISNKIDVMIGITLAEYETEIAILQQDYTDPVLKPLFDTYTLAIAIGNEETDVDRIVAGIKYARDLKFQGKLPQTVITTALKIDTIWIENTSPPSDATFTANFLELDKSLDVICFNMYDGYLERLSPLPVRLSWGETTPSVTLNGFGVVRFAMQKAAIIQSFWCTEVGWQSGNTTVEQLKEFYTNFLRFDTKKSFTAEGSSQPLLPPERIFYFTVRDSNNHTFGLYTSAAALTPKFS